MTLSRTVARRGREVSRAVEGFVFSEFYGRGGRGVGGGTTVVAVKGDILGTATGSTGIYVTYGGDDYFSTVTKVARSTREVGGVVGVEGDSNGEGGTRVSRKGTPRGFCSSAPGAFRAKASAAEKTTSKWG